MNPAKPLDLKTEAKPWFAVPYALTKIRFSGGPLKPVDALVLAYLIDLYQLAYKRNDFTEHKSRNWFYCTQKKLKSDLNINNDQQRAIIERLRAEKLIYCRLLDSFTGGRKKRHFRVNRSLIRSKLELHNEQLEREAKKKTKKVRIKKYG